MNERIKELVKEAGLTLVPNSKPIIYQGPMSELEKFAELIVEKFDDILVLELVDCIGNQDKQAEQRIERLRERVKTYFGVEE